MASSLKFVDSIVSSPTTRLDLNDKTTWRLHIEGTEFPPPPLDRAIAFTLLADGGVIPAAAYGLRKLRLRLSVDGASADATATQLQTFYRELDRPFNFLRWEQETTNPVFFRTFRTSADSVQEFGQADGSEKLLTVEILAEPFAYGLREDPVVDAVVSADPAAVSNGCFVDVTGVKGDVETPALIQWPSSAIANDRETVFAVRRRGTPSGLPFLFQAEAMTQGTDTTTQPNDANFSGAGNNYSRCTFATDATMQTRLQLTDLGTAGVDLRGKYRVFLRYRKNTPGDEINLQLDWGDPVGWLSVSNDVVASADSVELTTADLGLIDIPGGLDPVSDNDGAELDVSDSFLLQLQAERASGSGSIDFDFLLLVPADDRFAIVQWNDDSSSGSDHWILDANGTMSHARDASDRVITSAAPSIAGGFPMLSPGQANRIYMVRSVRPTDIWALTTVSPVSVSYMPRYLSVRPAST